MDADEFKVQDILGRNERFIVPLYQRQYQWHDSRDGNRTSAFWQDVAAKAGDVLDGRARFEHYMGALLLAPGATHRSFGMTPEIQVVDGQQRLTTFLVLLCAIREIAKEKSFEDIADECKQYLFNEPGRSDTDKLVRFKLTPTPVDSEVFLDLLGKPLIDVRRKYRSLGAYWGAGVPKNTPFRALRAYEFFIAQVADFLASGPGDDTEVDIDQDSRGNELEKSQEECDIAHIRLNAVLEALVFHLKLIVITLGEGDDAQVIFETLNSAGQPLLAMDLVRNNIFHRAEAQRRGRRGARERAKQLYEEVWAPFDDAWWREPAPSARPQRPRIDHFLANLLTAETGERTTVRELYAEYRAWATPNRRPRFEAVEDELAVLQKHAPTYRNLEGHLERNETIAWLGGRLRMWQHTTAYPIAFQIAEEQVDELTRKAIATLLDSYLTRRALCDLTPKNLNRLFPRLVSVLRRDGVSVATLRRFFAGQDSPTARFPDDRELRDCILAKRAYGRIRPHILSDILWRLELASRSSRTEATARPSQLWVEHVMPVAWEENWPLHGDVGESVGYDDPHYRERRREREEAIHTLGNLTIVTDKLNRSLSNLAFKEKKPKLIEHSNLTLNHRIAEREDWDESAIRGRGETLATLACTIWPTPMSFIKR